MTDSLPSSISINRALADYLGRESKGIVQDWTERAKGDPTLPNEGFSELALIDHLPFILGDLVEHLRQPRSGTVIADAAEDAHAHGLVRWRQGFNIRQVLQEISHLRSGLISQMSLFEEQYPHFGLNERVFASTTVHRYLDSLGMLSVEAVLRSGGVGAY